MVEIEELRIGSLVVDAINNEIIRVSGVSDNDYITIRKNGKEENIDIKNIEPLYLVDTLINQLIKFSIIQKNPRQKNKYYFSGNTTTYFLVHLIDKDQYLIGMLDTSLPEGYRRLTKPFYEYHKLQNGFKMIYDKELKLLLI
ncbi:hypothetical protein [Flavobacterium sp. 123]|uniref:hypothetical protein n=1 Tax=Flavobacterium sp. 123 TaxID=2135627 RepID=UPI000EAE0045|nr:hypothetical protein [Flavobacterium sp. 123]RKS98648.1 hypothetical protein C8C88_0395 [Flavobacterium sp. 123]